jgi:hypothetical protein
VSKKPKQNSPLASCPEADVKDPSRLSRWRALSE